MKNKFIVIIIFAFIFIFLTISSIKAVNNTGPAGGDTGPAGGDTGPAGGDTGPAGGDVPDTAYDLKELNLLGTTDITEVIGRVVKYIIGLSGTAALVVFIYGGVLFLFSEGKQPRIDKGKNAMLNAAIGLTIIFSSYIIIKFIITGLMSVSK